VCQDPEKTARRNALKKLNSFPPGLDVLYERMIHQISALDDAELCKHVLASIMLVYWPITRADLMALTELLDNIADQAEV
jgi:hypothetical protein